MKNSEYLNKTIKITEMDGEPIYKNKIGIVKYIDDAGQLHGTWGGCAIIPDIDKFIILKEGEN